jgi:hypothetical protein
LDKKQLLFWGMRIYTEIMIFNENGFINENDLNDLCIKFQKQTSFNFKTKSKEDFGPLSTIFREFSIPDLNFIVFLHGYVMEVNGDIKKSMLLLIELDKVIDEHIIYYVSATPRLENSEGAIYPRGAGITEIAQLLDQLFLNKDYTSALDN